MRCLGSSACVCLIFRHNKVVSHFCDEKRSHTCHSCTVCIVCVHDYVEHETACGASGHHHRLENTGKRQRAAHFGVQIGRNVVDTEDAEERKKETDKGLEGHFVRHGKKGKKGLVDWIDGIAGKSIF